MSCNLCKHEALLGNESPCNICYSPHSRTYLHFVSRIAPLEEAPKYVIPNENTPHALYTHSRNDVRLSSLHLVTEAIESGTEFQDQEQALRAQLANVAGIIARMICKMPVSVQLEILDLPYKAKKEGTENG